MRVFGSYSAPDGDQFGDPSKGKMFTSYGFEHGDYPVIEAQTTWDIDPETPHKRANERHEYWLCLLASMALTDPELRAGVELQRKEIDRLKQQLRDEGDRIAELKRAIEAMRVAGGSVEFQMAFDTAKALIVTPNEPLQATPRSGGRPGSDGCAQSDQ